MNHYKRLPYSGRRIDRKLQTFRSRPLGVEQLEARLLLAVDPIFRINAGGPQLSGTPNWQADTAASPSPYVNAATGNSVVATTTANVDISHPSLPPGTPMAIFQSERWDKPGGGEMQWDFPVTPGEYQVRLYFAETWTGGQVVGARVFDVQIENATVLDNYDVFADAGGFKGVVKSFTVTSDGNLDVDFLHVVQNPSIKGIEILGTSQSSSLVASTNAIDFGSVIVNDSTSHSMTLTNGGSPGSPNITIDPAQASLTPAGPPYTVAFQSTQPMVLSPGQSTTVTITFGPTAQTTHNATLTIPHTGENSPISVSLTGTGVANIPINFTKSALAGAPLDRPTKVQFGPDGRLYVAQQNGLLRIHDVVKDGSNDYRVISSQQLKIIQDIPNHNDDGTLNTTEKQRLVTGMLVIGTAQNPVIYVTSSDPRIGGGSTHEDLNVDSNSGTLSRLTWNGNSWVRLDLVRGLPRSEENHASNGITLDPINNILFIAQGGNTNMGAPSGNFTLLPEYALSAAVLSVDLNMIGNTTYDLPTLDDEDRAGVNDLNDPFGGNNGKNQAIIDPNGPVQVYAPGFRNPYDLQMTSAGRLYVMDNGPNAGWGGLPIGEGPGGNATNQPNEAGSITLEDQLHFVPGPGYYFGHPNPTRSNPNNTFNTSNPQSPVALVGPKAIESDYLIPPGEDGAIFTIPASSNGIDEYTVNTFGGQMQGDLIIASFDNTVKRVKLNAAGDAVVLSQNLFSNVGIRPLDIEVADSGPWAGTIWVADIGADSIFVYEPSTGGSGNPNDLDGDGYTNDDEQANGTDPNNAADAPADYDMDFVSNLTDDNDDNDAQLDHIDPFAIDPDNGSSTPIGTLYDFENEVNAGGLLNMGFTGLMSNGTDDYESLFDPAALTAGGAAGVFTIDSATAGTARGAVNTQEQAFQFGVDVTNQTTSFTARSSVLGPFGGITPQPGQEMGMYIGTGDQDNYVQVVLSGDAGGAVKVMKEIAGVFTTIASQNLTLPGPGFVDLYLAIDPIAFTVQASYSTDDQSLIPVGAPVVIPASWLGNSLAVGVIATDPTGSGALPVTWDFLGVEAGLPIIGDPAAFLRIDPPSGGLLAASTFVPGSFQITNNSTGNVRIQSVSIDARTALLPDAIFDPTGSGGNEGGKPFTPDSGAVETGLVGHTLSSPHDDGFDVLEIQFENFDPGEVFTFSIDMEPTSIKGSAAPGPSSAGKISGLELSGSTITVVFSNGTTTQTQTFRTSGSGRSSETTADTDVPAAPGLSLLGATTPPAIVTNPNQTLRVTGPAGAVARVLQAETGLYLAGVPGGGFDVDPFEANKAIKLTEYIVTIGPGGFVDVPVTLTRTEAEAGLNYFQAAIRDVNGRSGDVSSKIVLKLQDEIASGSAARVNFYTNGSLNNSSTATTGSFQIINQSLSGESITSVTINLPTSLLKDLVFDPIGGAGDLAGKPFTVDSGAVVTGQSSHLLSGSHDGGFDSLTINFDGFGPNETFTFSIDVDPTSIRGAVQPGPQQSASISGLELSGATITLQFSDGSTRTGQVFADSGSKVNSHVVVDSTTLGTPGLSMLGVASTPAIVTNAAQTVRITGPSGATVRLLQTEGALFLAGVPNDGFDIDAFESNKVILVQHTTATIGATGFVDVAVVLSDSHARGGVTTFVAVLQDQTGRTSPLSNFITVALNDDPATSGAVDVSGPIVGDFDGDADVDGSDFLNWQRGQSPEPHSADDLIDWTTYFGQPAPSSGVGVAFATAGATEVSDQPGVNDFAQVVALESVAASFAGGPIDGQRDRIAMPNHRDLVLRRRLSGLIAARALEVNGLILNAKLLRRTAEDVAFASAGRNSNELTPADAEPRELEWDLALEALGFDTRF